MVGLYRALGGGWEIRKGHDAVPADIKQEMTGRTNWGSLIKETPDKQEDPAAAGPGRYLPDY